MPEDVTRAPRMDAARWAEMKALFNDLVELGSAERNARLADISDARLRDDVRALLDADAVVGARFERAPMLTASLRESAEASDSTLPQGHRIGAWKLVRLLGRGGMGAVYEAVRDDADFTKRAALKMIARTNADVRLIARFEAERRILARLEHRNIAALLDGGVDAEGRPWFALEYVEGERIDQWCSTHDLDLRARVQLFRQACSAVQYAHERLIVHRDIKPANILVSADGTLKLLDFGIAKLIDDSEDPLTEFGLAPMTAAYASPEQRSGQHLTTSTDIYSLGVVLYELLTGLRPPVATASAPLPITVPPSERVVALDEQATSVAADLPTRRRVSRQLRGSLDAIVMMALRPEPDRRYASAQQFGDDLQRWLDGRTVRAQPDTIGYRITSFVRRNRLAVAGMATGLLALIGGTVISVRQATLARIERDRARAEEIRTQRVSEFFQRVLNQASPREGGRSLTVAEALDRAVPIIDTAFANEPDIRASVQLSLGETLQNVQLHERAKPLLQQAYAYYRARDRGAPSEQQTDAIWNLASVARQDGRREEAESLYLHLADVFRRRPDADANDVVVTLIRVAGLRLDAGDVAGSVAAYDSLIPKHLVRNRTDCARSRDLLRHARRGTGHARSLRAGVCRLLARREPLRHDPRQGQLRRRRGPATLRRCPAVRRPAGRGGSHGPTRHRDQHTGLRRRRHRDALGTADARDHPRQWQSVRRRHSRLQPDPVAPRARPPRHRCQRGLLARLPRLLPRGGWRDP
ncbi:MAG: serine/threonine-protein kinase [Gemmatimonadaceae bacterium]|nr:serine/threonine-protein kinase [Gemmatimonadaceae bacterium]